MGERGRVNTAVAILSVTGGLVVYSAFDKSFNVPPELWAIATGASMYFFSTAKRDEKEGGNDD